MKENKFIAFLIEHWSKFFLGVLAAACVLAWASRSLKNNQSRSQEDFLIAHQTFEHFRKGDPLSEQSIEATENVLKRHPELHPKYDALLALTLFSQAKNEAGMKYAQSMMRSVDKELPLFYQKYATTTFLIAQEEYTKAFNEALALHEELIGQPEFQTLDAMNLLRLVFLAHQLGDADQKNLFWQKLETHAAYPSIQSLFQEGSLSLKDYLKTSS